MTPTFVIDAQIWNLTVDDGVLLAGAILACWALGWAFRMLIRVLKSDGDSSTSESES